MSDIFNNELFEAFASASDNVFIYVCDMKTNISRWSKASVEYFGLSGEYLEDAATIWEQHIHPDDRALYNEDISGVFSGTKPRHECQYRARNRMGEYVWVECKGSVIWDDAGNPIMTRLDGQKISISASAGALLFQRMQIPGRGLSQSWNTLWNMPRQTAGEIWYFSLLKLPENMKGV
jgi:PAS domain S-box-containing protein